MIADLHALTSSTEVDIKTYTLACELLALGIDPSKTILFRQSDIPEHTALMWVLFQYTPIGLLERAHSYKDKIARGLKPHTGLFTYPILMAADILLYQADCVPVGEDQRQHLEIARDLAQKFNLEHMGAAGGFAFNIPEAYILQENVMVGTDGQKMSKSYDNTLGIFMDERLLKKTIMGIPTDSTPVQAPKPKNTPLLSLLSAVYARVAPGDIERFATSVAEGGIGYGEYKTVLLELLTEHFREARERYKEWFSSPEKVNALLERGAQSARAIAKETFSQLADTIGISYKW
jgi:tryptophanyl-tRNA synthetase